MSGQNVFLKKFFKPKPNQQTLPMNNKNNNYGPLAIIGILFFVFGFITWVNAVLIPFFQKAFDLNNTAAYLVTFGFYISYTAMALPSTWVLNKVGFKRGMSVGLFVMAIGAILFVPAARAESYQLFLVGLFIIATGLTLLQTASNPYVTILGPIESAAQRISILGIANKVAGIIGQKVFGGLLLVGGSAAAGKLTRGEELEKVVVPYLIIASVLVLLGLAVWFMKGLPEVEPEEEDAGLKAPLLQKKSVWAYPSLVFGLVALFAYVGAEVTAGDTIVKYGISQGFPEEQSKDFGTYTLWFMLVGYVLGIFLIPKYVSQGTWLKYSAIFGVIATLGAIFTSGFTSVLCIAFLGLGNAIMWPAIWPLALDGLGKFTKLASAFLVMMIAGGAILPLIYGRLSEMVGSQQAYWFLVPLYVFIFWYAATGHKKKSW
jgi:FHS family L-fucose permease-like MFS transporter